MDILTTGRYEENEHTVCQRVKATVWLSPVNGLKVFEKSLRARLVQCPVLCVVIVDYLLWGERRSDWGRGYSLVGRMDLG